MSAAGTASEDGDPPGHVRVAPPLSACGHPWRFAPVRHGSTYTFSCVHGCGVLQGDRGIPRRSAEVDSEACAVAVADAGRSQYSPTRRRGRTPETARSTSACCKRLSVTGTPRRCRRARTTDQAAEVPRPMTAVAEVLDAATSISKFGTLARSRFKTPREFRTMLDEVLGSEHVREQDFESAKIIVDMAARAIGSEKLWVSREMVDLCWAAEATLPEVPLQPDDLPWPAAVVAFEKPVGFCRRRGADQASPIDLVQWLSTTFVNSGPGVEVVSWSHLSYSALPVMETSWPFGENPTDGHEADEFMPRYHRFLFVLWSMLRGRIAVMHRTRPSRTASRRWERDHKLAPSDIVVITLRRPQTDTRSDEAARSIEWTHQWIVDGHWAPYWCGPRSDPHQEYRWLAPYVKGPKDKPLVVKDKVYAWTR